jgi:hypothetical protein
MRRIIALVIIGLVIAFAITQLPTKETRTTQTEGPPPINYFQQLQDCGAACLPLAAILVVVAE